MRIAPVPAAVLVVTAVACARSHLSPVVVPASTTQTASGLRYAITHHGSGPMPHTGQWVLVHYTGSLPDGKVFDSSRERGEPLGFQLGEHQVIRGWDEGIALLHVGDRAVLVIPPSLGYGAKGAGGVIPPDATLLFDVQLVGIRDSAAAPILVAALDAGGADSLRAAYHGLAASGRLQQLYFGEFALERAAGTALKAKQPSKAIALLQLATELYPRSSDAHSSLGEAYAAAGDTTRAIAEYRAAVHDNRGKTTGDAADRADAVTALQKLGATP